jgi:hypothetical protein
VPLIVPALLPLACPEVDAAFGIAAAAPIKMLACKKTATNNLLNLPLLKCSNNMPIVNRSSRIDFSRC